ncbi:hypothetical protein [Vibrio sp. R78045]|uniref:hypothetical protein n=1 Tax=Vibrio sp. R78045 TaxID=3093868 RepID=UPI0036F1B7F2
MNTIKSYLSLYLSAQSLKKAAQLWWTLFITRASVGCLLLAVFFVLNGNILQYIEIILHIMADTAKLGPAPEGMINISQCINAPTTPICPQYIVQTFPIEEAAQMTMQHSVTFILTFYYLAGALLGNGLSLARDSYQNLAPKIRSFINKRKYVQFEEDVNWCIAQMNHRFIDRPYWEETTTAYFTRGNNIDEQYWKSVNQTATKRLTDTPATLPYEEAYREINRIALLSINIMAGALLDCRYNKDINKKELEDILEITHDQLSVRAPSSLSEHDAMLEEVQSCIDHFCESIGEPSAEFIDYSDKLNQIRLTDTEQDFPNSTTVNALISKLAPLQDALNANIIPHTAYLSMILGRTGCGNNNVVYFGHAINAFCAASNYCMKNQVPLHVVDMMRPSLINEEQKEQILSRTQRHDRYSLLFEHDELDQINKSMDTQEPDTYALLNILDLITQYSMVDEKQNILIIQNFHKSQYPKWFNNIIVDITCFNRVCWSNIIFTDSGFK